MKRKTISPGILSKTAAEVLTALLPHQQRVVDRLKEQPGLVVAHGLGTGKTLSSIAAAANQGGNTTVLAPASLIPNYQKEIAKHLKGPANIQVRSQQRDALSGESIPSDLLIVDEAHKARETSTNLNKLLAQYPAAKRILLTATPVYNRPSDIAPLVNIAAGKSVLPIGSTFDERYIKKPPRDPSWWYRISGKPMKPTLRNTKELKGILQKWVDYQDNKGGDFPTRMDERVRVPMSEMQTQLHAAAWGKLPRHLRKKLELGIVPTGKDLSAFNKFESQTRQISGSANKYIQEGASPKTMRAVQELAKHVQSDPASKAIVYSNFLNNLTEYQQQLEAQGIPNKLFTGSVSPKERQAAIDEYNTGKLKALLLSSAGGEGLDLKGTRLVQVLEPHWNEEKLDQVIGRAIRHGSHTELPEDKRNVLVQQYITHPQANLWQKIMRKSPIGVEDVLADMSKNKKDLNSQLMQLLQREEVPAPGSSQ
jgi:SNF2 family DNA or RNA helicase